MTKATKNKTVKCVDGFTYTTAIKKLRKLTKRTKVIPGGTSAGKTYGIIPILIDKAIRHKKDISIVSESMPHLRRGAMRDFKKIMQATGRWIDGNFSKSLSVYSFASGGSIEFFGVDQPDKLRGARRSILYINECNNVPFEAYQQLSIRTSDEVWLDYNPTSEFWVHKDVIDDPDVDLLRLTYKDNEALAPAIIQEIEKAKEKAKDSKYWANWWRVYGLGLTGSLEGVIFDNWTLIDALPAESKLLSIGLDFGYTNDPTAIIAVYYHNGMRIVNEMCYKTGMVNSDIAAMLPKNVTVWADSAEPKSIEEIRRKGIDIRPVKKGKDSINFGIQLMQQQNYLITKSSTNLIKELRSYCWDKDKNDNTLNKPIDDFNHCIDALRYNEMMNLGLGNKFFVI